MPNQEPATCIQDVRRVDQFRDDLQTICENAAEIDGEVLVAVREYPSSEYKYLYNRHQISIVRARLEMRGYSVDSKTVMDDKCSRLILTIINENIATKIVRAEKLK